MEIPRSPPPPPPPLPPPRFFSENKPEDLDLQWFWESALSPSPESRGILPDPFQSQDNDAISGSPTFDIDFGQDWFDFDSWQAENAADVEDLSSGDQPTPSELGKPNQCAEISYAE
jgi:hypothetical protein